MTVDKKFPKRVETIHQTVTAQPGTMAICAAMLGNDKPAKQIMFDLIMVAAWFITIDRYDNGNDSVYCEPVIVGEGSLYNSIGVIQANGIVIDEVGDIYSDVDSFKKEFCDLYNCTEWVRGMP